MPTNPFTVARNAIWNSILNYTHDDWGLVDLTRPTGTLFGKIYRHDEEQAGRVALEPSPSDLPAIEVTPQNVVPRWWTGNLQQYPQFYRIRIWSRDWNLTTADDLLFRVQRSLFAPSHPLGDFSYIKAPPTQSPPGIGREAQMGPFTRSFQWVAVEQETDGTKVTVTDLSVILTINDAIFGS